MQINTHTPDAPWKLGIGTLLIVNFDVTNVTGGTYWLYADFNPETGVRTIRGQNSSLGGRGRACHKKREAMLAVIALCEALNFGASLPKGAIQLYKY